MPSSSLPNYTRRHFALVPLNLDAMHHVDYKIEDIEGGLLDNMDVEAFAATTDEAIFIIFPNQGYLNLCVRFFVLY